jgi:hypothetical protein
LRLNLRFRFAVYGAFSVLLVTGVGWWLADALKASSDGEAWQAVAANLLMIHGGIAMVTLMLLGAVFPLHVRLAWRSRRNRITGTAMVIANGALILTAFGLYYLGSEAIRPWASTLHLVVGGILPALFFTHIWLGRRSS